MAKTEKAVLELITPAPLIFIRSNSHITVNTDKRAPLAVLGRFHVNSMQLLHQPDSILVDLGLCFRTGRIAFKHIGSQLLA